VPRSAITRQDDGPVPWTDRRAWAGLIGTTVTRASIDDRYEVS
jgi:hypothetical protein